MTSSSSATQQILNYMLLMLDMFCLCVFVSLQPAAGVEAENSIRGHFRGALSSSAYPPLVADVHAETQGLQDTAIAHVYGNFISTSLSLTRVDANLHPTLVHTNRSLDAPMPATTMLLATPLDVFYGKHFPSKHMYDLCILSPT